MDSFNWVYAIPLAAIIGGVAIAIFAMYFKNKKDIAMAPGTDAMVALEENSRINRQLLTRLDALDARVAAIEDRVSRVP